jgi:hypothetical protein
MSKIEIGLGPIVEHINFPVLEGVHRPGIDIEIRIEFLKNNTETARFEECSK